MNNYELNVISHHKDFKNKTLKKFYVDGIETVGAYGDEPFTIQFKNNTWQKVQVIISIDGTNVLNGEKASTNSENRMWVVNPYSKMELSAWCETDFGGAGFVFTNANNSVAIHTHGDLSSRGIIAAAVYVEGYSEPTQITNHHHHHYYRNRNYPYDWYSGPVWGGYYGSLGTYNASGSEVPNSGGVSYNSNILRSTNKASADNTSNEVNVKSLESLVAVGAGQHVDQKISYVQGIVKPTLSETVRVKYLWWDELQTKLRDNHVPAPHASGFPGDKKQKNIDLGKTPRIGNFGKSFPIEPAPIYTRV